MQPTLPSQVAPPLPPDAFLEDLIQKAGDPSARAYAQTEQKTPAVAARSYLTFRNRTKQIYTPIVRKITGGM